MGQLLRWSCSECRLHDLSPDTPPAGVSYKVPLATRRISATSVSVSAACGRQLLVLREAVGWGVGFLGVAVVTWVW